MPDPLADVGDLTARGITVPSGMDADAILAAASDAVADAAGCPISVATSTVTLVVDEPRCFDLPGGPVQSVASVTVGGVPVSGWVKFANSVRMPTTRWWGTGCLPVEVTVTYTHGYPVIPADIVDLVCGMAAIALNTGGDYGSAGRISLVRLGDFEERTSQPAGADSPSPVGLPDSVRNRLRARFGTSAVMVGMR